MKKAPARTKFVDAAGGIYNADLGQTPSRYYDKDGKLIYEDQPGRQDAWNLAMRSSTGKMTAKLKQFGRPWNQAFANGTFATVACPAWMLGYIKEQGRRRRQGQVGRRAVPGGGGNWGGSFLGVPTASKHQKEAVELAKWLTAPEQQVRRCSKQGTSRRSTAAYEPAAASDAKDPYFSNAPIGKIFGESAASTCSRSSSAPKDGEIRDAFTNAMLSVEQQGESPDKAGQDARRASRTDRRSAVSAAAGGPRPPGRRRPSRPTATTAHHRPLRPPPAAPAPTRRRAARIARFDRSRRVARTPTSRRSSCSSAPSGCSRSSTPPGSRCTGRAADTRTR